MNPIYYDSKTVDHYWTRLYSLQNVITYGKLSPLRQKPHNFELFDNEWSTLQLKDEWGNPTDLSTWIAYTPWDYDPLIMSSADEAGLMIKHRNAIGEKSLNVLDMLRTRKETISMVTSNVMSLVKSLRLLKKGKWRKAAHALGVSPKGAPKSQNVPQRWLELQYGWLPLLSDIYAAGNSIFRDPVYSVTTRRKIDDVDSGKNERYAQAHYIDTVKYRVRKTRHALTSWFSIESDVVTTLDNLGVTNPTLVMWEAVPWSFVVDWLVPVGDFLSSLTALNGVKIISTSRTIVVDVLTTSSSKTRGHTKTSGHGRVHYIKKSRVVPFDLSVVLPSFENPLSLNHFANAMSLLATAFKSKS